MSALILILSFLFFPTVKAQTLLVPDPTVSFETYSEKCIKDGYLCTQKYFAEEITQKPTPRFDQFLDSMDLTNKAFVDALPKNLQQLLQREMISLEQLDMLLRLLEQLESHQQISLAHKNILAELKFIYQNLMSEPSPDFQNDEIIIYFKKPLARARFQKLKKSYLALPHYEVSFNALPKPKNFKDLSELQSGHLVEGECEKAIVSEEIKMKSWSVLSEKSCGWSQTVTRSTSGLTTTLKENKKWFITGAFLIGAAVLANQYEVSFEF